jgi:hypothetical protein
MARTVRHGQPVRTTPHRRRVVPAVLVSGLLVVTAGSVSAQIAVHDAAVTARNAATAIAKEYLLNVQRTQHAQLREMAERLSLFTDLAKYVLDEPPRWRTHGGDFVYASPFNDALIFGDADGTAYTALTHPLADVNGRISQLPAAARRAIEARLATVNLTDAAAIAAVHDTGQLRYNGRKQELPAIDVLEAHVIDPSSEQSATAVLDKISGAVLIGARQRQARIQLLTGVLEQLLVDSKRARDTEAAMLSMQLATWRESRAANKAFVHGTDDALRTWRQP